MTPSDLRLLAGTIEGCSHSSELDRLAKALRAKADRLEAMERERVPECPFYVFNGCAHPDLCRGAGSCKAPGYVAALRAEAAEIIKCPHGNLSDCQQCVDAGYTASPPVQQQGSEGEGGGGVEGSQHADDPKREALGRSPDVAGQYSEGERGEALSVSDDAPGTRIAGVAPGPSPDQFETLFVVVHPTYGHVRVQIWPEGLCFWVGGMIQWREWKDGLKTPFAPTTDATARNAGRECDHPWHGYAVSLSPFVAATCPGCEGTWKHPTPSAPAADAGAERDAIEECDDFWHDGMKRIEPHCMTCGKDWKRQPPAAAAGPKGGDATFAQGPQIPDPTEAGYVAAPSPEQGGGALRARARTLANFMARHIVGTEFAANDETCRICIEFAESALRAAIAEAQAVPPPPEPAQQDEVERVARELLDALDASNNVDQVRAIARLRAALRQDASAQKMQGEYAAVVGRLNEAHDILFAGSQRVFADVASDGADAILSLTAQIERLTRERDQLTQDVEFHKGWVTANANDAKAKGIALKATEAQRDAMQKVVEAANSVRLLREMQTRFGGKSHDGAVERDLEAAVDWLVATLSALPAPAGENGNGG